MEITKLKDRINTIKVQQFKKLDSSIHQHLLWVNGILTHCSISGACLPDMSCCKPELFEENLSIRMRHLSMLVNIRVSMAEELNI